MKIDYAVNQAPTCIEVEAAALFKQVGERIRPLTEPLEISLQFEFSPASLWLYVDPEHLAGCQQCTWPRDRGCGRWRYA